MSAPQSFLNTKMISTIRRNHALEHATLNILAARNPHRSLAGYSDSGGFWLAGAVPTEEVKAAVNQAIVRLQAGEVGLAVHAGCGTNFVAAGLAGGTAAWLATLGGGATWKKKLERWPLVVALVTLALIFTQPLGPWLQARVTTRADIGDLRVIEIMRRDRSNMTIHRIRTQINRKEQA